MTLSHKFVLGIIAAVLLTGLGTAIIGGRPPLERTFRGAVKDLLPSSADVPGWTVEYQPIADTPEMKAKVGELLNYDDAVFAVYRRGRERFSIYIAYWAPGKMSHRLVAGHTPDVCWVGAGWKVVGAQSAVSLVGGAGSQLLPAEQRAMMLTGNTEHVVFWHLLDGQPMSYGTYWRPPWHAFFTDLFAWGLNQRPEQFFVRVSSGEPIDRLPVEFVVLSRLLAAPRSNPATK